ncbi:surface antigen [Rhodopseudomonas rhenobacensis]|uniref:Surface antigen n=2 Tax=Rhodopseudomonas rhenobacensis TaxID=87461 RepID=A0A7W7Z6E3_9BRAD|nr:RT0821/Lpp0805 family surface protein [Rhodopseudomonas rhenobacensis]MBB5048866.1 surface antigen [Rhodopseudomonas rhenobacensis]
MLLTTILIGVGAGGCSLSRNDAAYAQMGGASDVTGSIGALTHSANNNDAPSDADLALARNAASDVLTKGDKDSSQPWENPLTGARGSVTPLASVYSTDGRSCRDFLASYVKDRSESWLQGSGCRTASGQWEIHTLKPWRKG